MKTLDKLIFLPILIYIVVIGWLAVKSYLSYTASLYDLGIMDQTAWNTSQGRILQESVNRGYLTSRLALAHWELIYIPISLAYLVWASPIALLLIQTVALAWGALAVYWLGREILGRQVFALAFMCSYLLYPALQNANLFDVHGLTFSTPLLLFTFYYFHLEKYGKGLIFAFLSLMCREDIALILFMVGLYIAVIQKRRYVGMGLAVVSACWFALFFSKNLIGLSDWFDSSARLTITEYGKLIEPKAIAKSANLLSGLFENLSLLRFDLLVSKQNVWLIIKLFLPVMFLSFLSPGRLIWGFPILAIYMLADWTEAHDINHHYAAPLIPVIFSSAIYGLKNLASWMERPNLAQKLPNLLRSRSMAIGAIGVLVMSFLSCFLWSNAFAVREGIYESRKGVIAQALKLIPDDASVSADRFLGAHIAHRKNLYHFPTHMETSDYVLYDLYSHAIRIQFFHEGSMSFPWVRPMNEHIARLLQNRDFGTLFYKDGILLLRRGFDYEVGLKNFVLTRSIQEYSGAREQITMLPQIKFIDCITHPRGGYWQNDLHFTLYWQCTDTIEQDFKFHFKLVHVKSGETYFLEHIPALGLYPPYKWKSSEIIRDELFVPLDSPLPSGEYHFYAKRHDVMFNGFNAKKDDIRLFSFVY